MLDSVVVGDFVLMEFFSMIQSAESKCLLSRAINRGFGLILPYFFVNSNSFSRVFETSLESSLMTTKSNVEFTFRQNHHFRLIYKRAICCLTANTISFVQKHISEGFE